MVPKPVNVENKKNGVFWGRGVFYMGNSNLNLGPTSWGLSACAREGLWTFDRYNRNQNYLGL